MKKLSPSNTRDYLELRTEQLVNEQDSGYRLLVDAVCKAEPLLTQDGFRAETDPLSMFITCINAGACPPASVMILLADCFKYFESFPLRDNEKYFKRIFYPREPGRRGSVRMRLKNEMEKDKLEAKVRYLKTQGMNRNEAIQYLKESNKIFIEPESIRQRLWRRRHQTK